MKTVEEKPKPVELEKITPISVEKPLKYIEKVNFPIDSKTRDSTARSSTNEGLQNLSAGYASNTARAKA